MAYKNLTEELSIKLFAFYTTDYWFCVRVSKRLSDTLVGVWFKMWFLRDFFLT